MKTNSKYRILMGIRQGKVGGGESVLLSLVENLNRELFEPTVLSFTEGPMVDQLRQMGVSVHVIYTEKPFDFLVWKKVRQLIRDGKIDLVHAHGTRAASNMLWAARKEKLPFIYTCHGWSFHQDQKPLVRKMRIRGERYLTRNATLTICVSNANRNEGISLFGEGFDPVVIQNSIDARKFDPSKSYKNVREEFGIADTEILFASVARFTWQKQPLVLIKAFADARRHISDIRLLMVGDGEEKQQAVELVDHLHLGESVILESFRQDVPDILAAVDVFVLPSLWEGLPVALLEAMSMGKAIIASRVDGTAEVLEDGETGILIDTNSLEKNLTQAITRVAADKDLREGLGRQARLKIEQHYGVETMTQKNEEIYLKILSPVRE